MVVTASRQSAVQMARAIKSYIKDRDYDTKYPDLGVLVAFSGSLTVDGRRHADPTQLTLPSGSLLSERATGWEAGLATEHRWGTIRASFFAAAREVWHGASAADLRNSAAEKI